MHIEGNWENVNDLYDIARIIREYYNEELADRMYELIDEKAYSEDMISRMDDLEDMIEQIRSIVL